MNSNQASHRTALIALGAALAGMLARQAEGAAHVFALPAAPAPDDITAYVRAICVSIALIVNLGVGSYHSIKIAWTSGRAVFVKLQRARKRRKHRAAPAAPKVP